MRTRFFFLVVVLCLLGIQTISALTYTVNVPAETNVVYIVGDATGGWGNWFKMQRVGDANQFTINLEDASETDEYCYAAGNGWAYEELDAEGKPTSHTTWSELDEAIAFRAYASLDVLTFTVNVPAETKVCYIVGGVTNWQFIKMQRVGNANQFTVGIQSADAGPYADREGYEYAAGPGWAYEEGALRSQWTELDEVTSFKAYFIPSRIISADFNNQMVYSREHRIYADGEFSEIRILDLTGKEIQSAQGNQPFASKLLNVGVYIVKTDYQVWKLIVKE
ncbi:MAG: T9SS type A sorting domain-containing protein [Dysgonamonadaceae bacterium]|jgi:hypothetical protein|nr:T9SS type A sorting domain-containing protein [Dysgonamonadaceae bacterium]